MWWLPGQRASSSGSAVDTPHPRPDIRELERQLTLGAAHTLHVPQHWRGSPTSLIWHWVESRNRDDRHHTWPVWPMCHTVPMVWKDRVAQAMFKLSAEWGALQLYAIDRTLRG